MEGKVSRILELVQQDEQGSHTILGYLLADEQGQLSIEPLNDDPNTLFELESMRESATFRYDIAHDNPNDPFYDSTPAQIALYKASRWINNIHANPRWKKTLST